ncbi:MAG: Na/Pi cotransporter family protein [Lachnospiraceae bacterium]|nr:Na/Pi cotransporter family protein [Lachnospiraceae bacterium]
MNIFDFITLFGGLAMFLYGMRLMGNGLKESSSGTLKKALEKVTRTPFTAFLMGVGMTAVIQSSTATIVITAGLVGAGIVSLRNSLGIVVGANVGTTVTGQIIRLLDLNTSGNVSFLEFFKPSTLAPIALIIGVIAFMNSKIGISEKTAQIIIGFGILFSGLMNMMEAVGKLMETGIIENLFTMMGDNPVIGYMVGAGVAFVLQSSSASIGILQAFSTSGLLTFSEIYAVLVGIYLGDCVTTAIVCNIGARPDAKRVGLVNILFNLSKTVLILIVVNVAHSMGLLNFIWNSTIRSGGIANTNTIFNLVCAILLLPMLGVYENISRKLIKDEPGDEEIGHVEKLDALNPVFYSTPAIAFNACYEVLLEMYQLARKNVMRSLELVTQFDPEKVKKVDRDEKLIDLMADKVNNYLIQISAHITAKNHIEILNHYYSAIGEFEHLGDKATNICEIAESMNKENITFSKSAIKELNVLRELLTTVLDYTDVTFRKCNVEAARHIEPLEEVVDDMVALLKENHLERLNKGECSVFSGTEFLNLLTEVEHISDLCSNVGLATVARVTPEMKHQIHNYLSDLHSGNDEVFNKEYKEAKERYFRLLA